MKRVLPLAFFLLCFSLFLNAQNKTVQNTASFSHSNDIVKAGPSQSVTDNTHSGKTKWTATPELMPGNLKAFQENKGQFINTVNEWKVLFGCDYHGSRILFTDKGVIYQIPEAIKVNPDSIKVDGVVSKQIEEQKDHIVKVVTHNVSINWENTNENLSIEAVGEKPYYFGGTDPVNKGKSIENIKGFEKLIYHDVYPGIDVEYTFHPKEGIKYAVRVKAGYNAGALKMLYSGQQNLSIDNSGNVHIGTAVGDIIDHAPVTYQNGAEISSSFKKSGDSEVSFEVNKADPSLDFVIDPWTVTPTTGTFIPSNVGIDGANNVYIAGSYAAGGFKSEITMYEQKYTAAGALSWTYAFTQLQSNGFIQITTLESDLAVDPAGNSYVPAPYYFSNSTGNVYALVSLSTGGTLNYFNNSFNSNTVFEIWNLTYSCNGSTLVQAGAGPSAQQGEVSLITPSNGNLGGVYNGVYGSNPGEVYAGCIAPNGFYYGLASALEFTGNSATDALLCWNIAGATPALLWQTNSGYSFDDFEVKNPWGIGNNGIAGGCAYLYTSDGLVLQQRNLNTGAVINSVNLPGGNNGHAGEDDTGPGNDNSGVAVDLACGYVYAGSGSAVYVYDENLNPITSVATPGNVLDVKFGNGLVSACGYSGTNGFVMQFPAQTCTNTLVITRTNTTCGNSNGTANCQTPTFCAPPYTYLWNTGATTQNITGLAAGTYTVNVGTSTSCVSVSDTVIINPSTGVNVTTTVTTGGCTGSIDITVTGGVSPYTYSWSSGQTTSNITGVPAGGYTVTVNDNAGCVQTATATVTGAVLTITPSQTNLSCNGDSNGTATLTVSGGSLPYTYAWAGGQTTSAITGLKSGNYTCTVTEHGGCSGTASITITEPAAITATSTVTPPSCGATNGAAGLVTVAGGTGAYTYLWNTGQTTSSISNVGAGSYTVTIKDANSCTEPIIIAVPNSNGPRDSITYTLNEKCFGGTTGAAAVGVSRGTPGYTYTWAPVGGTHDTASNLAAGSYTVTVKDASGCTNTATVTITSPPALRDSITSVVEEPCFGDSKGSLTVGVKGGTGAYSYVWTPGGETVDPATSLAAGNYKVVVTDGNGCKDSTNGTITQPTKLVITAKQFSVTCHGACNGQLVSLVSGGTGAYSYNWSNGATVAGVSNVCPGTYSLVVTDGNGCTADTTGLIITEPTAITGTVTPTTAHCSQADGSACVSAAGGTPGYTYVWSNSITSTCINNVLPAGYSVIITDANKCNDTIKTVVPNLPGDTAVITSTTNVTCNGGTNGTATGNGKGNNPPFTYSWSTATIQTTQTATGLSAGAYTLTVTDAVGCKSTVIANITQPALVVSTPGPAQTICIGQSTVLTVTTVGGTPGYTYNWMPGALTGPSVNVSPTVTTTYTISTTDANNCPGAPVMIVVTVHPPLSITISPNEATCPGGSVSFTATAKGGDGTYTYTWLPSTGLNTSTGSTVISTPAGNTEYTVIASDACGTAPVTDSVEAIIDPLPVVNFTADTLSGCSPLCVNFSNQTTIAAPGKQTSWSWSFGDGGSSVKDTPTKYCYQNAGVYTVALTVTSDSGCKSSLTIPNMITVYSHPVAAFSASPQPATILNPTINFIDQSTDAYGIKSWLWKFGDPLDGTSTIENPTYTYADTGMYCVMLTVTNIHSCQDSVEHCEVIEPYYTFYIPNAFTPNGNGLNDVFNPKGTYICDFKMYIFDRWGMQLFYTTDMNQGWNGTVAGGTSQAQEDTYVYLIEVVDCVQHNKHQYLGRVTLIK